MSEKVESHIFARGVYFTLQENRPIKGAKARSSPHYLRDDHNAGCIVPVFYYQHVRGASQRPAATNAYMH